MFLNILMFLCSSIMLQDSTFDLEPSVEDAEEREEHEEDKENEEPPATADDLSEPEPEPGWSQASKKKRKRSSSTEAQAQDLAMLNTLTESIKSLTSLHSTPTPPPPPADNITSYCKYLEGELRAIGDPQQLRTVMFQMSQILYSSSQPVLPQSDFGYRY